MSSRRHASTTGTGACLLLALALLPGAAAAQEEVIPAERAVRHAGTTGTVCGRVDRTRHALNTEGEPTFLYMGGTYPRHTFAARIPGHIRGTFQPAPEDLQGKDVCIVGSIERDSHRAEIAVKSASDIKLARIQTR